MIFFCFFFAMDQGLRVSKVGDGVLNKGRYGPIPWLESDLNEVMTKRLTFWRDEILSCCSELGVVCITVERLQNLYKKSDGSEPQCLGRVVADLARSKDLVREEEVFKHSVVKSFMGYLMKPVHWVVGEALVEPGPSDVFVNSKVLSDICESVLATLAQRGKLHTEEVVRACVKSKCHFDEDVDVVIEWIRQNQLFVMMESGDFWRRPTEHTTDVDVTLAQLHHTLDQLLEQEKTMHSKSDSLKQDALACAKSGNRRRALHLLHRRRLIDEACDRRSAQATNIQLVTIRLEEAVGSSAVVSLLKDAVKCMQTVTVDPEEARQVMEDLEEASMEQDIVHDALTSGNRVENDEEALEEELKQLVQLDDVETKLMQMQLPDEDLQLPDVPKRPVVVEAPKKLALLERMNE